MTRVLLIRHGETSWNRDRRWQGHADIALSREGLDQAVRLAVRLREQREGIDALVSSDLRRASDTAQELANALGLALSLEPSWREMDVGRWTGLSREEIEQRYAEDWRRIAGGEDLPRGGGETFAGFSSRIVAALDSLRTRHAERTVAVVTHGGVIRAALLHALGLPFERLREVSRVDNAVMRELRWNAGSWVVAAPNHLTSLEARG